MGKILNSSFEELKARIDLVSHATRRFGEGIKMGKEVLFHCPLHGDDKHPSLNVDTTRNIWKCRVCEKGGSVIDLERELMGNVSIRVVAESLAKEYGIELQYEGGNTPARDYSRLYDLLKLVAEMFYSLLRDTDPRNEKAKSARTYLAADRRLDRETATALQVGFSGTGSEIFDLLKSKGFTVQEGIDAGVISPPQDGKKARARFYNRVMFPILDHQGRIISFGGRTVDKDSKAPKYVNGPETSVYKKGNVLYGLSTAMPFIRQEKRVLVVEGYMDLASLYKAGIRNVVATCGTALTENHVGLIKRLSGEDVEVVLFLDGDEAGKKAAIRALPLFGVQKIHPRIVSPPAGVKDPDDWTKASPVEEIRNAIANAPKFMDFAIETGYAKFDFSQAQGKVSFARAMGKLVAGLPSDEKYVYGKIIEGLTNVPACIIAGTTFETSSDAVEIPTALPCVCGKNLLLKGKNFTCPCGVNTEDTEETRKALLDKLPKVPIAV